MIAQNFIFYYVQDTIIMRTLKEKLISDGPQISISRPRLRLGPAHKKSVFNMGHPEHPRIF